MAAWSHSSPQKERLAAPLSPLAAALLTTLLCLATPSRVRAADPISFEAPVNYTIIGTPNYLKTVDLDGDGNRDIVVGSGDHSSLFYGNGDGTFASPVNLGPAGPVEVADLDADGKPDLIIGYDGGGIFLVYRNLGGRVYDTPTQYPFAGTRTLGISVGDFNNDGKPDVAVPVYDLGYFGVYLNDGSGGLGTPAYFWSEGALGEIVTRDFNGDGNLDAAVRSANSNSVTISLGDGAGNFTWNSQLSTGNGSGFLLAGDFTGDGRVDLMTDEYWDNALSLFSGNPDGTFNPRSVYGANGLPLGFGAGDFDGDGNLDVAAANAGTFPGYFSVLRNPGGGVFETPVTFTSGDNNPRQLAVGDFNNDGQPDVVITNDTTFGTHIESSISVFLNNTLPAEPALSAVTVSPASVIGSDSATGTVTLDSPAPAGGAIVSLSDDIAATTLPASVTVPEGATSANFTITTVYVGATQSGTVTATYQGESRTASVTVRPVGVSALTIIPNPVEGGKKATAQVTLDHAAGPGGIIVTLTSSDPSVTLPSSVTVQAGQTTATFMIKTKKTNVTKMVTITAAAGGTNVSQVLTVTP
jgi:hypothetical protein